MINHAKVFSEIDVFPVWVYYLHAFDLALSFLPVSVFEFVVELKVIPSNPDPVLMSNYRLSGDVNKIE
jgi:hypothetical protein